MQHWRGWQLRAARATIVASAGLALILSGTQAAIASTTAAEEDIPPATIAELKAAVHDDIEPIAVAGAERRAAAVEDCREAPTADGESLCIAPAETSTFGRSDVGTRAVQPIPSWCANNFNGGRLVTRTQDCETFDVTITKRVTTNGTTTIVGTASVALYSYQYTSYSTAAVAHQYGFSVSTITGDVSGITMSAASNCTGSCVHTAAAILATPVALTGWHEAEAFTLPPSTAIGSIYYLATGWVLTVNLPGSTTGPSTVPTDQYDLRCDNAAGGSAPSAGCAVYYAPGRVAFSSASNPTLVAHLSQAIGSGLPGGSVLDPLHRTQVQSVINLNRSIACGGVSGPAGTTCDEYPFASSYEGAASGGSARSFPGCSLSDPPATGPVGYSRCMVVAGQNSSGGAILGNTYRQQRILDGDPFYVALS